MGNTFISIIEGSNTSVIKWHKTSKAADDWLAMWLKDNKHSREDVRVTIAKCLVTISG